MIPACDGYNTSKADALGKAHTWTTGTERPCRSRERRLDPTLEQRIATKEQELKKLKRQARSEERKARTHRLVTSAATIEAEAGHVELDETMAQWLGRALAAELANPESEIARHVSVRASREGGGAE